LAAKLGQVRSKEVLKAYLCQKRELSPNVTFFQYRRAFLLPQDGLQNAPRSAQDGSERLLKRNLFALENRLKFGSVWGPIWMHLGPLKRSDKSDSKSTSDLSCDTDIILLFCIVLDHLQDCPRGPKTTTRAPKRAPRGRQERPRRLPVERLRLLGSP